MKKILILGGGFAGIEAAISLQKNRQFEVTVVSDRDYLFLYPISIWIPTHKKTFEQAKISLLKLQRKHRFNLSIDTIQKIDSQKQMVFGDHQNYSYDYLIVALGAHKMKPQGHEHTLSICGNPEGSMAIGKQLDELLSKGNGKIAMGFGGNPSDKSAVRGGPAFELIFNVHHYLKEKKLRENFELTFFAPMEQPGAKMGPSSLKMLDKMFNQYNIQTRIGKKIVGFAPNQIQFEDQSTLNADLIMFIPGATGHAALKDSDLPLSEANFIQIDDTCLVKGTKNVYAIGDTAAIEGPDWRAKQGHLAEAMAKIAAFNIIETEKGSSKRKGYQKHLSIICVMDTGKGAAFILRNYTKAIIIPLPIVGHWMKLGRGKYARWSKLKLIPRLPGM